MTKESEGNFEEVRKYRRDLRGMRFSKEAVQELLKEDAMGSAEQEEIAAAVLQLSSKKSVTIKFLTPRNQE